MAELWRRLRGLEDRFGRVEGEVAGHSPERPPGLRREMSWQDAVHSPERMSGHGTVIMRQASCAPFFGPPCPSTDDEAARTKCSVKRSFSWDSSRFPEGSPLGSYRGSAPTTPGVIASSRSTGTHSSRSIAECARLECARQAVVKRHPSLSSVGCASSPGGRWTSASTPVLPRSGTASPVFPSPASGLQPVVVTQVHKYLAWVKSPSDSQQAVPASPGAGLCHLPDAARSDCTLQACPVDAQNVGFTHTESCPRIPTMVSLDSTNDVARISCDAATTIAL